MKCQFCGTEIIRGTDCPSCRLIGIPPFKDEEVAEEMVSMQDKLSEMDKLPPEQYCVTIPEPLKTVEFRHEARIERVRSGFILTTYNPEEDAVYTVERDLFEDERDATSSLDPDVKSFIALVQSLAEYYGILGSKHDKQRFWVGLIDKRGRRVLGD